MNCDRIGMLLERRWDGPLTELEERMVQDHLSRCAACREENEAIRLADVAFLDLADLEPPINIAAAVAQRIARETTVEPRRAWFWALIAAITAAWSAVAHYGITLPSWVCDSVCIRVAHTAVASWADSMSWWLNPVTTALRAAGPILVPILILSAVLNGVLLTVWLTRRNAGSRGFGVKL